MFAQKASIAGIAPELNPCPLNITGWYHQQRKGERDQVACISDETERKDSEMLSSAS
jgi:hypothetical protein